MRLTGTFLALLMLAGCTDSGAGESEEAAPTASSQPSPSPSTFMAVGELTLIDSGVLSTGSGCAGTGGYDDIRAGAQVVIRDSNGTAVAMGHLETGKTGRTRVECTFQFLIDDVPESEGLYSVEVSHRGEVQFTREDMGSPIRLSLS